MTLLNWEDLVKQVHVMSTDHQRRKQNANTPKNIIIAKLATEFFRPSPFELTDNLVRTKKKWEKLNIKAKERKESLPERKRFVPDNLLQEMKHGQESEDNESMNIKVRLDCRCKSGVSPPVNSEVSTTAIQDTSNHKHKRTSTMTTPKSSIDITETARPEIDILKPAFIVTNNRKLISADSKIKINFPSTVPLPKITQTVTEERFSFIPSVSIFCTPPKLSIIDDHLIDQTIQFSITNGSTKYVHLKYIDVTDRFYFCYAYVCPNHSHKVYPGMSVTFKLYFKLNMRKKVFTSMLFFRVTCNRTYNRPTEGYVVPIISDYLKTRSVDVSEAVYIPPIYSWHFKKSIEDPCSTGMIEVSINDGYSYHLHINRRSEDFTQPEENNLSSTNMSGYLPLSNLIEMNSDLEIKYMAVIVDSLVERALDTFFINTSYMYVKSKIKKYKIPVYLHTIEHVGCHNCYYDLIFYDAYTDEFIFRRTTRIFAEILPSPVEVSPPLLDMSCVPINHSFGESVFYITNHHKLFPVLIKIILTKNMKRLFRVIPMETVIPINTKVAYQIKFCTLDAMRSTADNMVYFAFEIAMFGPKFIYKDMPHIYYEVIAPCLVYYKKITHRVE